MNALPSLPGLRVTANAQARAGLAYGPMENALFTEEGHRAAFDEIVAWPGYAATPLVSLPGLAAAAGVGSVWIKDESGRFGLGSFKALGGAYAVLRVLMAETRAVSAAALLADGPARAAAGRITVCCATDGNHGRSVAWGARRFGCRCVIYVHATVSEGRCAAIARYGAKVIRTPGSYDDSVRAADADARRNGWHVVSDTTYPGYEAIPRDVMDGYTVMAEEAYRQCPARPTHVVVQAGVGAVAASVCAHFWRRWGPHRPLFIVAEPEKADCLYRSGAAGALTADDGPLDTLMAGLACGEPSVLAWRLLSRGADAFATMPDDAAVALMRLLAEGVDGDPPLVIGESSGVGLAALLAALADPTARAMLGLGPKARLLAFSTEGDTDPELYRELVGRGADEVRRAG